MDRGYWSHMDPQCEETDGQTDRQTERQTDTTENITFLQFHWREATKMIADEFQ